MSELEEKKRIGKRQRLMAKMKDQHQLDSVLVHMQCYIKPWICMSEQTWVPGQKIIAAVKTWGLVRHHTKPNHGLAFNSAAAAARPEEVCSLQAPACLLIHAKGINWASV